MTLLGALARLHVDFVVRDDLVFLNLKYDVVDLVTTYQIVRPSYTVRHTKDL